MIARGKRRAKRGASPLGKSKKQDQGLKVRNKLPPYYALSGLEHIFYFVTRGDALRFAARLPLAIIFRAFGAVWHNFQSLRFSVLSKFKQSVYELY